MFDTMLTRVAQAAAGCENRSFFGFPVWDKYLQHNPDCGPKLTAMGDIWLILLALIEILLRVAVFVAIAYVLLGGFKYITSRANPDKVSTAKTTVIDALIGLVIAVAATAVVSFIAGRFS
jgi:hypothetical protein